MKILIIGNIRRSQGGITTQILELKDSLVSEGIDVELVSTHGSIAERLKSLVRAYSAAGKCGVILGVGCAYYGVFPMLVASVVSKLRRKKIVYNFHDGQVREFISKYRGLLGVFFGKNKIVVATEYLAKSFRDCDFEPYVISNHLNGIKINPGRKYDGGAVRIIWARSFESLYRADIALDGAAETLKKRKTEFHFFGGGTLKEFYMEKYRGVEGIVFRDFVPRDELLREYGKFDVFINTSDYDNFPMSIVEAGMNGLTVLTSDASGIASLYSSEEVMFFEKGNAGDFKNKLDDVTANPEKYSYLKENLAKKISGFTWENIRDRWLGLLNETSN